MEQDFDFNGSPDTCEFRTKEENTKILKTDFGCDGSIDVWTYETEQEKWVKIDLNSDNLFDMSAYFKNGKKVKLEVDLNFDGRFDASQFYNNGDFTHCEINVDHNGIPEHTFHRAHDFDNWTKDNYPEVINLQKRFFNRPDYKR